MKDTNQLGSEFIAKFTVWNDKYKLATLKGKEEYPTPDMIADAKIALSKHTYTEPKYQLNAMRNQGIDHSESIIRSHIK